jgi:hypothetical protein
MPARVHCWAESRTLWGRVEPEFVQHEAEPCQNATRGVGYRGSVLDPEVGANLALASGRQKSSLIPIDWGEGRGAL